ncbi:putative MerR family transcriptional regulator [Gordonia effusa NBRC 100432]|uniref:Putative MerR family transcriptional regulator n=1 Tax=Gordonia effusa NBRC 100432 TaxID=1077974 RepID=H0QW79_9ACTN|nr:MerR family transcriptional regulator [Gordonia effusa]GAB17080.1 putative MerR family transcriptional regulator [Gordonia effusa NBRC 100432]
MTEYRIDDLARAAGTTTRNVRGYQDRGLLPRPARRGRIAIYTDAHLTRLQVINNLLRRGFTIRHISDFLLGIQRGDDLADVLGLNEVVTEPWSTSTSTTMTAADLKELLNTASPVQMERLVEFGLIEPIVDADPPAYQVNDADTIFAYSRLVKLGIPLANISEIHGRVDAEMSGIAATLISSGRRAITDQYSDGWLPQTDSESDWAAELLGELRRAGMISAHNMLNRALDRDMARQLSQYLEASKNDGAE